jgi:hypothetical protein
MIPEVPLEQRVAGASEAVVVLTGRISPETLRRLVQESFGDMVKFVVDVEQGRIAIGGQLHADAELRMLEEGSRQEALWGANYYPGRGREGCIEFTSLINIRPAQGNPEMEVRDDILRERIRALTYSLIGEGGDL